MTIIDKFKKLDKKLYIIILLLVVVILGGMLIGSDSLANGGKVENVKSIDFDLGNDLVVTEVGRYSGPYMEDGSDEEVTNVMMIQVTNNGEYALQYAEVTLSGEDGDAVFKLSTVEPGETVMVLEADRQKYSRGNDIEGASAKNVVFFKEELNTYSDKLEIQPLDGGLNVTNISGKDIDGEIVIYFKDFDGDMLVGGITYRGRISDGLAAGEIRQLMSENFTADNTKVMFITIDGN